VCGGALAGCFEKQGEGSGVAKNATLVLVLATLCVLHSRHTPQIRTPQAKEEDVETIKKAI
jgi:hypothetical protein